MLTPDEIPSPADTVTDLGQTIKANTKGERALASEPMYQGEPVLAVAAIDEVTAANAIESIEIDWEPLPFNVDPLDSLRPGRPNARVEGNVWVRPPAQQGQPAPLPEVQEIKWTDQDFADATDGRLPMGKTTDEWSYGDVEAGFKSAALVLDETFSTPNTNHETSSRGRPWRTGRTGSSTCTPARRAPCRPCCRSHVGCTSNRPMSS